jgi:hypothetical protein
VRVVHRVRRDAPPPRGDGVEREQQLSLVVDPVDERVQERAEALGRRGAGTERRRAAEERLLQLDLPVADERGQQAAAVAEAAVDCADADPGLAGDVVDRQPVEAVARDQGTRSLEDSPAVADGVGTLSSTGTRSGCPWRRS